MVEVKHRKAIYREVFNWHENRLKALIACPAADTDAFWKETCDSICEVANRLENNNFALELLTAVFFELDRTARELHK